MSKLTNSIRDFIVTVVAIEGQIPPLYRICNELDLDPRVASPVLRLFCEETGVTPTTQQLMTPKMKVFVDEWSRTPEKTHYEVAEKLGIQRTSIRNMRNWLLRHGGMDTELNTVLTKARRVDNSAGGKYGTQTYVHIVAGKYAGCGGILTHIGDEGYKIHFWTADSPPKEKTVVFQDCDLVWHESLYDNVKKRNIIKKRNVNKYGRNYTEC